MHTILACITALLCLLSTMALGIIWVTPTTPSAMTFFVQIFLMAVATFTGLATYELTKEDY